MEWESIWLERQPCLVFDLHTWQEVVMNCGMSKYLIGKPGMFSTWLTPHENWIWILECQITHMTTKAHLMKTDYE